MRKLFENFKSGITIGAGILFILLLGGSIYATLNWNDMEEVGVGDTLKASSWNDIIENMEALKNKVNDLEIENNTLSGQLANLSVTQNFVAPANAVVAFNLASCPEGWIPANGSNNTPDLRGKFIRGLNSFENGNNKLTGTNSDEDGVSRILGSYQGDAIRNIVGEFAIHKGSFGSTSVFSGVFSVAQYLTQNSSAQQAGTSALGVRFDASSVVPTGSDNRPKNIALIYCVKE